MKRVGIIGGGIAGLSAAYYLEKQRRAGADVAYELFEASPRFGGVLKTERVNGCIIEAGPDSFLTVKPAAAELCRELDIGDQLIGSNDAERKTYIVRRNRLVEIPAGMQMMVPSKPVAAFFSPLFSLPTKLRFLEEWMMPPDVLPEAEDESVGSFVERHFGAEMVDVLAEPLLAGVYGGDADAMSARAVLPQMLAMEAKHRSLVRGALKPKPKSPNGAPPPAQPLFSSLRDGMQTLPDAIVAQLQAKVLHAATPVTALRRSAGGWQLQTESRLSDFDELVIATPAHIASQVLEPTAAELSGELSAIEYSSSIIVVLGYDQAAAEAAGNKLPEGFGFLVPRSEQRRMLACTFVHKKFLGRVPAGKQVIRCFIGGLRNRDLLESSNESLAELAGRELADILEASGGWRAEPEFIRVYKWPRAMAQYHVGHLERLARIDHLVAALPGLHLIGNAYRGIGIPDCIRSGRDVATKLTGPQATATLQSR